MGRSSTSDTPEHERKNGRPHDLRYVSLHLARKSNKRPQSVTTPKERPRVLWIPLGSGMFRVILLAVLAAGFALYGLIRHFTHPYQSMLAPEGSVEIPAPEIEPLDQ